MREAQGELEVLALGGHAVTGAVDLQNLRVARGDADDHVGDQGTREAVEFLGLALVIGAVDVQLAAVLLDRDRVGDGVRELALGAFDLDGLTRDGDIDAGRDRNRLTSDSRHGFSVSSYQTKARTSPPTLRLRACLSVSSPWDVEMIATPRPPSTRGSPSDLA